MFSRHIAELRVQPGRLVVVVRNGLPPIRPETILIQWIDVDRRADGMSSADVIFAPGMGGGGEDIGDGSRGGCPFGRFLLFDAIAHCILINNTIAIIVGQQYRTGTHKMLMLHPP